jgi:hypothetical protein
MHGNEIYAYVFAVELAILTSFDHRKTEQKILKTSHLCRQLYIASLPSRSSAPLPSPVQSSPSMVVLIVRAAAVNNRRG